MTSNLLIPRQVYVFLMFVAACGGPEPMETSRSSPSTPPSPGSASPEEPKFRSVSIVNTCVNLVVSLQAADCDDPEWGDDRLSSDQLDVYDRMNFLIPDETNCVDVRLRTNTNVVRGARVELNPGESAMLTTCGASGGFVPTHALTDDFHSPSKDSMLVAHNSCSNYFCKVDRRECGGNRWVPMSDRPGLDHEIPTGSRTVFKFVPAGCQEFRFIPCYPDRHRTWSVSGEFEPGLIYEAVLCGEN